MAPLWILVALALTGAAYFASGVLIPLLVSLFLAVLLEPLVAWCEARGLRRSRGAPLVVLAFLLAVAAAIWACSQPFSAIAADMPRYTAKIRVAVSAFDRRALRFTSSPELVHEALRPSAPGAAGAAGGDGVNSWSQFFWRGLGSFFEAAGIAAFVPFLMIVLLSEKGSLVAAFTRLAGASCDAGLIFRETEQMVRAYFWGNFVAGAATASLHWALFAGLGLKNAVGLGLVTGFLTLIPLLGLPAALLLPTAQGLLQFDRALPFVLLAAGMSALHLLTANYVLPSVIGGRVKINAAAAMAGLLFWGWLWGVTGFVLAVPLTAGLMVLLESRKSTEPWAGLLAAKPRMRRHWFGRRWLSEARGAARTLSPR
jgi:predicted PurR-regulated permease PerM